MDKVAVNRRLGLFKFWFVLSLITNTSVSCQTHYSELSITRNETKAVSIDILSKIGNNCQVALYISVNPKAAVAENVSARKSGSIKFTIAEPNTESQVAFNVKVDDEVLGQKKKLHEVCFDSCKSIKALNLTVTSHIEAEKFISIEAIKGRGTCEVDDQSENQEIDVLIGFIILFIIAIIFGIIFSMGNGKPIISHIITWWLKTILKQHATYEQANFEKEQKDTKTVNSISKEPLLFKNEIEKCSKLRRLSVGVCAILLLNGLQIMVVGFNKNTADPITQGSTFCPAEPLLPAYQIKVGTWLCMATVMRVAATMLCYFIFTEIYYKNNQNFTCGKCCYFIGHFILILFDCANFGIFIFFSTIYIKMFSDTLKPEDVELSVEDLNYCDKGLYASALLGFIILSILVWSAIVMLVIHIGTVIKIFKRYIRGDVVLNYEVESECLNINSLPMIR